MSLKKTVDKQQPHAILVDARSGFTWKVLKTYQTPENERKNKFSRWLCYVTSPMTHGGGDMGDCYIRDVLSSGRLVECTDEFAEAYGIRKPSPPEEIVFQGVGA